MHLAVWDYHWVNSQTQNLTWGPSLGGTELPGVAQLDIPLRDVLRASRLQDEFQLPGLAGGVCLDAELSWMPVLKSSS